MSGEPVVLQGGPDIEALVRAASLVVEHSGVTTAVIGGLAVTCRLATVHRATADVDVVVSEPEVATGDRSVADRLVASGVARRDPTVPPARLVLLLRRKPEYTQNRVDGSGLIEPYRPPASSPSMADHRARAVVGPAPLRS